VDSSERAIRHSTQNALTLARAKGYRSIAFPIIGSGTGGGSADMALTIIQSEIEGMDYEGEDRIVRFVRSLRR
jgi:O-acetyl-ADP-ribose deacetylase